VRDKSIFVGPNDFQNTFDITVNPGVVWDELNTFNTENNEGKWEITKNEGKGFVISGPSAEGEEA